MGMRNWKQIGPRVRQSTCAWYSDYHGRSLNAAAEWVLEAWPVIFQGAIEGILEHFSGAEEETIFHVGNRGPVATESYLTGEWLLLKLRADAAQDNGTDELADKVAALSHFERSCLEFWVQCGD